MTDGVDPHRSWLMSRVRGRDTAPELRIRRLSHALGYRHRLHRRDLPGTPDLVYPARRKVVFVHGCLWHGHEGCRRFRLPRSNADYWSAKIARNRARDESAVQRLEAFGWRALVVWECETADPDALARKLREFLDS